VIVPFELSILGTRRGYVSPELALGWRIGDHAREVFGGLDHVQMASRMQDDSAVALSEMVKRESVFGDFQVVSGARPWDVLCYHLSSGTVYAYCSVREETTLPWEDAEAAECLRADGTAFRNEYRQALDDLICKLLALELTDLCAIHEYRVRKMLAESLGRRQICRRCGRRLLPGDSLWDVEGVVCCPACCGLERSWLTFH